MSLFSDDEKLSFRFVGIFPRLPPPYPSVKFGESRNLGRWIRLSVTSGVSLINADPTDTLNTSRSDLLFLLSLERTPLRAAVLHRRRRRPRRLTAGRTPPEEFSTDEDIFSLAAVDLVHYQARICSSPDANSLQSVPAVCVLFVICSFFRSA